MMLGKSEDLSELNIQLWSMRQHSHVAVKEFANEHVNIEDVLSNSCHGKELH
jgi:hypothetical protein